MALFPRVSLWTCKVILQGKALSERLVNVPYQRNKAASGRFLAMRAVIPFQT